MSEREPEIGDVVLYTDYNVPPTVRLGMIICVRTELTESTGMADLVVFNADCRFDVATLIASVPHREASGEPGWRWKESKS